MRLILHRLPAQWQVNIHLAWLRVRFFAREIWSQAPAMFLVAAIVVPSIVALFTVTVVLLAPVLYGLAVAYGLVMLALAIAKFIAVWRGR